MFAIYLISIILFCIFSTLCYIHLKIYKNLHSLPGPSLLQYYKNLFKPAPNAEDAFEQLLNLNRQYGSVVKIWTNPFTPKLVVTNLKYIKQLLSSHAHLEKTKFYDYFDTFAGLGLTASPGALWKTQRKSLNSAFRTKILEKYEETFEQLGHELISELKQNANGVTFDILKAVNSVDVHCFQYVKSDPVCIPFVTKTRSDLDECTKYFRAREGFYRILVDRSLSLLTQYDFVFKFTRTYTKRERWVKVLNGFSERIMEDYKRELNRAGGYDDKHAIDVIFEICDMGSKEMIDHISTFIVAGHETISVALSFAIYELAKHPEVQRKIIEEYNLILGEDKDGALKLSDLQKLKYAECVVKESLRMYPTVPAFERKTTEDMQIDGVSIPKGADILISVYNIHMDQENYPNPTMFDPDRFLPENDHKIKPFSFIPFSLGPRNCIGKQYAMLEMKYLLTKILRNYEVLPAEMEMKMRLLSEFSLKSSIGMPVRLIPRNGRK